MSYGVWLTGMLVMAAVADTGLRAGDPEPMSHAQRRARQPALW